MPLKFHALLIDAPGLERGMQTFEQTREACEVWAKDKLSNLTDEQKVTAYVRIYELVKERVEDIHTAKVPGGFAIALYEGEQRREQQNPHSRVLADA